MGVDQYLKYRKENGKAGTPFSVSMHETEGHAQTPISEEDAARKAYDQSVETNLQGMAENAPETEEEKAAREKKERNWRLISGIGNAINGVAGMVSGFTGGYAFPNENKKEDPVEKSIDKSKQERLERAQRYYNFAQANNKALEDYLKRKQDIQDRAAARRYNEARAKYYENHAENEGVEAGKKADLIDSAINKNNSQGEAAVIRANNAGTRTSGGRSGAGSKADDPDKFQFIKNHDGSTKYTFRTKDIYTDACRAADAFIPKKEPYYRQNPLTGEWTPIKTAVERVQLYASSPESRSNEKFWKRLEEYSYEKSDSTATAPPAKKKSPFAGATQQGSAQQQTRKTGITL